MSNLKFLTVAIVLIFLFNSCKKKEVINEIPERLCENQTKNHFSGIVNGDLKCFNTGQYNYQHYIGSWSGSNEGGPILGRYVLGMNTFPVNEGDEHIFLYTPLVVLRDPEKIASLFPKRKLSIDEISNYRLHYDLVTKAENDFPVETIKLNAHFDNDSSIEVIHCEKNTIDGIITFKVTLLINCKLYNDSGILKGEIKSGELAGTIFLHS